MSPAAQAVPINSIQKKSSPAAEAILEEFRAEAPAIRRLLERVPSDKLTWRPHAKSRTLGELSWHIAALSGFGSKIGDANEFAAGTGTPTQPQSTEEILAMFEKGSKASEESVAKLTDDCLQANWRLTYMGHEVFTKKRAAALRTNWLNHIYHHRGQIGVYLRLLDVPVPVVYGPTADENPFA